MPATVDEPVTETTTALLHGRVIDVFGGGISGVSLTAGVTSGVGGVFELSALPGAATIVSDDPRWATVLAGSTRPLDNNSHATIWNASHEATWVADSTSSSATLINDRGTVFGAD